MLSQPLNSILALCLLTLSYCSAMQRNPSIGSSSRSTQRNGIISATCSGRFYNHAMLNLAANDAKDLLDELEYEKVDLKMIEYTQTQQEEITMPFSPPYYFHALTEDNDGSFVADFVVVTRDGKLAKVFTEFKSPPRIIDCEIRYA